MLRSSFLAFSLFTAMVVSAQSSSERAAVRITATVQATPSITLNWASIASTSSITIYRKAKTATAWGSAVATPSASALSWTDNSVAIGSNYEYKIVRVSAGVTGTGYINTGVQIPVVDHRGKLILLVDNTLTSALSTEITQLINDLRADGWGVVRSDVSRTASVTSIKSIIQGHYNADPSQVKALYILGHVPVPYAGNIAPDGHDDMRGSRPTDAYYADMDGSWTDNSVNTTITSTQRTWNTPGDGKFDQSDLPSSVELQVGRVDMYDMPAFGTTEVQLLRNYLNKAHSYKVKGWTPQNRSVLVDNLQWVGNPIAASGWRASQLVGPASPVPPAPVLSFKNYINGQSYLWTAHYGGGQIALDGTVSTYNGTDGGATTQELASSVTMGGVFNMALGSFFYDYDSRNNFLRAVIARGDGLTNCWAGIPAWYFHHMGLGENIGYSVAASMNNSGLYTPTTEGWQTSIGRTHMNLMGDPSLRMKMVAPPANLAVTNNGGAAAFTWTASSESVVGYHIFHVDATSGAITRLTTNPVAGTSLNSGSIPFVAGRQYMVRAVALETSASGSYYNMSLGVMAVASGTGSADCTGVVGGSATVGTPCNDNNACTTNDVYNASCQCVGTSITPAATIGASGPTSFCVGGSVVLNANTGSGYSYAWRRDGTPISGATSSSYTATQAGSYLVTVTYNGCSSTSTTAVVSTTSAPSATISASGATTFCNGGSVVLTGNTGTGYTYQWYRNGTAVSGATASTYTATLAGSYTRRVSNGGCATTSSALTVTVSGGTAPTATAQGATSFCTGGSVVISTATATGNSYQWKLNGTAISGATGSSYTANQTGAFSVTVTNGSCVGTSNAVNVNATGGTVPTIAAQGATAFCSGGNVILTTAQATGNSYQWKLNGSAISGATSYAYTAYQAGAMTVTVTNGSCTTTSAALNIAVNTMPSATISASGPTTFCNGGSVVLTGNTGTGYTYQWYRNGSAVSGATASTYTAALAGSYTRRVSNGGCATISSALTVNVSGGTAPTATAQGTTSFCNGGSVVISTATATGNSYQWKLNGTAISGATGSSYTATQTGAFSVTVTNGSCVVTSNAVNVNVGSASTPTVTPQGSTSFCTGGSVALTTTTATGNSYQWRLNGTAINGATSSTYTATQTGTFSVTVTNGGCSATSTGTSVNASGGIAATITPYGPTSFCSGGNVILVTAQAAGNSYQWRLNGVAISGATSYAYTAYQTGAMTVTVTNGSCAGTSPAVNILVGTSPNATLTAAGSTTFCAGGSVVLNANTGSGLSYGWARNGTSISGATGSSYTATLAGTYTVTVTRDGCSKSSSPVSVVVNSAPTLSCSNNPNTGSVSVSATGGLAPYSYNWNTSPATNSTTANVNSSGTYTVVVTDARGCTSTCSTTITISATDPCAGTRTETQATWGASATTGSPSAYMVSNFAGAFPAPNYLTIGCSTKLLRLTSAAAVINFLPSSGSNSTLPNGTMLNPTSSSYGNSFAGQLVALKLSVRFDELNANFSPSTTMLKNRVVASGIFAGYTVQQVINESDAKIGGCGSQFTRPQLYNALTAILNGYAGGTVDSGYLECPGDGMMLEPSSVNNSPSDEDVLSASEPLLVTVYPNPTNGLTNIHFTPQSDLQATTLEIRALSGALVETQNLGVLPIGVPYRAVWNAEAHKAGVYLYRLTTATETVSGRIVVE